MYSIPAIFIFHVAHGLPDVAVSQQLTGRLTVKDSLLCILYQLYVYTVCVVLWDI